MKNLIIITLLVAALTSCGTKEVRVSSLLYGCENIKAPLWAETGDTLRVSDGVGYAYDRADIIQAVGHLSIVQ